MPDYNLDDHGQTDRILYDSYVEEKFPSMEDKTVAITGTSVNGMGFYLAESAIRNKAKTLICLNRESGSAKKGAEGLQAIKEKCKSPTAIKAVTCDMQDLEVVKAAGEEVKKLTARDGLDVLVCNSGIMAVKDLRTKDGFDIQMQTNQLSHFLLTSSVWPSLKTAAEKRGEARVVTHSSSARDQPSGDLKKEYFTKSEAGTLGGDKTNMMLEFVGFKGPWTRYHQTKLANSAFTMELHRRLQEKGITNIKAMSADPGLATSNLQVTSTQEGLMPHWLARMLAGQGHSAPDGSLSAAMGAYSPEANSGDMYQPEKGTAGKPVKCIAGGVPVKKGKEKLTCNPDNGKNVWAWCEESLGIQFDL